MLPNGLNTIFNFILDVFDRAYIIQVYMDVEIGEIWHRFGGGDPLFSHCFASLLVGRMFRML